MQMPGSANRSVNCEYKAATEDIFTSLVKASTVGWTANEMHAVGFAEVVSETGHDCQSEIDWGAVAVGCQSPCFLRQEIAPVFHENMLLVGGNCLCASSRARLKWQHSLVAPLFA